MVDADGAKQRIVVEPVRLLCAEGREVVRIGAVRSPRRLAVGIEQPGVAGKRRGRLVGRSVDVDRADGQHLPVAKARRGEPVGKAPGIRAQVTRAARSGE
jgi:hypothetical protein